MGELRRNPLTGEWVILAPVRSERPGAERMGAPEEPAPEGSAAPEPVREEPAAGEPALMEPPEADPRCPFCPGNEDQTPPPLWEDPPGGQWQVRVVPNRYPALRAHSSSIYGPSVHRSGPFETRSAYGYHEVIIDSRLHTLSMADMEPEALERALKVYRLRCRALAEQPGVRYIALYRNEGQEAGASQDHPHAQVVALPLVPPEVDRRWRRAVRFAQREGACLLCRVMEEEEREGARWVYGNEYFAALCPFAPRYKDEVWIVPRRHCPSFVHARDEELAVLARLLKVVLKALRDGLEHLPFNLVFYDSPLTARVAGAWQGGPQGSPFPGHWFLQIAPRRTKTAGFEAGTGMYIVARWPEETAAQLRAALSL